MGKLTKGQRLEIVNRYQEGERQAALARAYEVTPQSVAKVLRRAGVELGVAPEHFSEHEILVAKTLYAEGRTTAEVAACLSRSVAGVCGVLNKVGVLVGSAAAKRRRVPQETRDAVVADYQAGASLTEAATNHGTTVGIVHLELKRRGIERRGTGARPRFHSDPAAEQEILDLYAQGYMIGALAEWFDCSRDAVESLLRRHRVRRRPADTGGYGWTDRRGRRFVFRSTWELKTAVWLDGQGRQWDYEREALRLSDGRHYTPDFWIVDEDGSERLLEVKGAYFAASKARIDLFRKDRPDVVLDVWREPELRARGILDIPLPDFVVKPLRSTRRIPPELRRQVIALYSAGCSLGEIKATTGVGASVVCNTIKAAGVAMPRSERRRLASASRAVRDRVADLYADGRSIAVVARTLGLSKDVVYGEIKRRGIVRPRPGAA